MTAAAAIRDLLQRDIVRRVVVLTKKSVVTQFRDELRRFWPRLPEAVRVTTHHAYFRRHAQPDPAALAETFLVVDESHEFTNVRAAGTLRLLDQRLQAWQ